MTISRELCGIGVFLLASASVSDAQAIATLALQGQNIPGQGNVLFVQGTAISNSGHALLHVATDNPDPNLNRLILDEHGLVVLRAGDPLSAPPGAAIGWFNGGEVCISGNGIAAYLIGLAPFPSSPGNGLYIGPNPNLAFMEMDVTSAPELPVGSVLSQVLIQKLNTVGQVAFQATVDDPGIAGQYNYPALMVIDTVTGAQSARYKRGDILPGQTYGISGLVWDTYGISINDSGQVLFGAGTYDTPGHNNVLYLDGTKVAQTGEGSPWGGNYLTVSSSVYGSALNNHGDVVFACNLGAQDGIVRNGGAFVREGDEIPSISPFRLSELGQPIFIGDNGAVLWSGQWNDAGTTRRGLFAEYALIVEQGVTRIGGLLIQDLTLLDQSYNMSQSGQYVVFEATLEGGLQGAFLIDLWQ